MNSPFPQEDLPRPTKKIVKDVSEDFRGGAKLRSGEDRTRLSQDEEISTITVSDSVLPGYQHPGCLLNLPPTRNDAVTRPGSVIKTAAEVVQHAGVREREAHPSVHIVTRAQRARERQQRSTDSRSQLFEAVANRSQLQLLGVVLLVVGGA